MALIQEIRIKREKKGNGTEENGYTRILGNDNLGKLISYVHGTVISSGTELEEIIQAECNSIPDFHSFVEKDWKNSTGILMASKEQLKAEFIRKKKKSYVPDFVIFNCDDKECYIIELKAGSMFDVKKSEGELETLENFTSLIARKVHFTCKSYLCGFFANSIEELFIGLKEKFPKDQLLTGKNLCTLMKINYNKIYNIYTGDQKQNFKYFIDELSSIPEIKKYLNI